MIYIILYGISLQCFLTYFCLKFKTRITPHNINNILFFDLRHTSSRKDHLHSCQHLPQKKERNERKQNKRPRGLDGHMSTITFRWTYQGVPCLRAFQASFWSISHNVKLLFYFGGGLQGHHNNVFSFLKYI